MGEIADMMLDGTMCQGCGEWLNDGEDGPGYPGYCSACAPDEEYDDPVTASMLPKSTALLKALRKKKTPCPQCGKHVKAVGLWQHERDVHGSPNADVEETTK